MKTIFRDRDFEELTRRLDSLRPDSPRGWGTMSAHGAVCHLTDSLRIMLGERDAEGDDGHVPRPGAVMRFIGKLYALTSPLPWPKGVPTAAAADQQRGGTPPGDFDTDVLSLKQALERFRHRDGQGMPFHVYFGHMSRSQWGRWAYRHTDHHLRQFGA